jgi:hypothetical protein
MRAADHPLSIVTVVTMPVKRKQTGLQRQCRSGADYQAPDGPTEPDRGGHSMPDLGAQATIDSEVRPRNEGCGGTYKERNRVCASSG